MKTLIIIIVAIALTSCGIPVAIGVEGDHGSYYYGTKSGLTITARTNK